MCSKYIGGGWPPKKRSKKGKNSTWRPPGVLSFVHRVLSMSVLAPQCLGLNCPCTIRCLPPAVPAGVGNYFSVKFSETCTNHSKNLWIFSKTWFFVILVFLIFDHFQMVNFRLEAKMADPRLTATIPKTPDMDRVHHGESKKYRFDAQLPVDQKL